MEHQRLNKIEKPDDGTEKAFGQVSISASLHLFSRIEKESSLNYKVRRGIIYKLDDYDLPVETLNLLSWIALFFAQKKEDSTAVALSRDRDTLTIHVSISGEALSNETRLRSQAFLSCICQTIVQHSQHNTVTPAEADPHYHTLIKMLVTNCWPMICHRIEELKATISRAGGPDALKQLWFQQTKHQSTEKSTIANSPPGEQLGVHIVKLVATNIPRLSNDTQEARLKCFTDVLVTCEALVTHHSVPQLDDSAWYTNLSYNEYHTLDETFRSIHSLHDYHALTTELLADGVTFLRQQIGAFSDEVALRNHIKVVWVHDELKVPLNSKCNWDVSPKEWIDNLFHLFAGRSQYCCPEDPAHGDMVTKLCEGAWIKGEAIPLRIHPEVELLYYLEHKKLTTFDVIGTDSALCFACGMYFNKVNNLQRRYWVTRPTALNKVEKDWMLPPVASSHPIGKMKWTSPSATGMGFVMRIRTTDSIDTYLDKHRETPKIKRNFDMYTRAADEL